MDQETGIVSLMDLGFTRLEAEIYTFLVQNPPSTGYRIAQAIGKPAANVYKALQTLELKGALLIDESENRMCRAVEYSELLDRMERQFTDSKNKASASLASLRTEDNDDRVYQVKTREQVLERCRNMLETVQEIIIIDAYPEMLETLKPDINKAIKRGVNVAVNAYQPVSIPGAELFDRPDGERFMRRWPGYWINIIKDGDEYIIAFFDRKGQVVQAVWSSSPYLSWVYYSALLSELQLVALKNNILRGTDYSQLLQIIDNYDKFFTLEASGYKKLKKRFAEIAGIDPDMDNSIYTY